MLWHKLSCRNGLRFFVLENANYKSKMFDLISTYFKTMMNAVIAVRANI